MRNLDAGSGSMIYVKAGDSHHPYTTGFNDEFSAMP